MIATFANGSGIGLAPSPGRAVRAALLPAPARAAVPPEVDEVAAPPEPIGAGPNPAVLRLLPRISPPPARILVPWHASGLAAALQVRGYRAILGPADGLAARVGRGTYEILATTGEFARFAPPDRDRWVRGAAEALAPGGFLFGAFLDFRGGGPPFGTDCDELRSRFAPWFDAVLVEPSAHRDRSTGFAQIEAIFRRIEA